MSSTNKTAHYNLPQFVTGDKPSWLTDENAAMTAIDAAMYANSQAAAQASALAETAKTAADNALSVADSAVSMFDDISGTGSAVPIKDTGAGLSFYTSTVKLGASTPLISFPFMGIGTLFNSVGNNIYYIGRYEGKLYPFLNSFRPTPGNSYVVSRLGVGLIENQLFSLCAYYDDTTRNTIFLVWRPGGFTSSPTLKNCSMSLFKPDALNFTFTETPN